MMIEGNRTCFQFSNFFFFLFPSIPRTNAILLEFKAHPNPSFSSPLLLICSDRISISNKNRIH